MTNIARDLFARTAANEIQHYFSVDMTLSKWIYLLTYGN